MSRLSAEVWITAVLHYVYVMIDTVFMEPCPFINGLGTWWPSAAWTGTAAESQAVLIEVKELQ